MNKEEYYDKIDNLPVDGWTKETLKQLTDSSIFDGHSKEIYCGIGANNMKEGYPRELLFAFLEVTPCLIEQYVRNDFTYARLRYLDNERNYRIMVRRNENMIKIGRHADEHDALSPSEFMPVVKFIKEKMVKAAKVSETKVPEFSEDCAFNVKNFDYSFLVDCKINEIEEILAKKKGKDYSRL